MTAHPSAVNDALIVGAGPAGTAAAIRLRHRGQRVTVIDREPSPRAKACGEWLSPRAVTALEELGVDTSGFHRIDHVRFTHGGSTSSVPWPDHGGFADHGVVAPRDELDRRLVEVAVDLGAAVLGGHEATAPIVERGFVRGARVATTDGVDFELRATYTIVADGANSTFGRALGTFRDPDWPYAVAQRAVFRSPLHSASEVELVLDLHDQADTPITGYGWLAPRGDGTVNVGVMILSTSASFQVLNPVHVLEQLVETRAGVWSLSSEALEPTAGGRIPMGGSIGPVAGPTYVVVGDAAAAANPMSGAGVEYALETGSLAGSVVADALDEGTATALQTYPQLLADHYGSYFRVGRLASRVLGQPAANRRLGRLMASRPAVADAVLRLGANELRSSSTGLAETIYRATRLVSMVTPEA